MRRDCGSGWEYKSSKIDLKNTNKQTKKYKRRYEKSKRILYDKMKNNW